jgi:hypothetical protein
MPRRIQVLSEVRDRLAANDSFQRVFTTPIAAGPFQQVVAAKNILYPVFYQLNAGQLEALGRAAQSVGDDAMFLSVIGHLEPQPSKPTDWIIPLEDLASYQSLRGYHLTLESALYSPRGLWGLVTFEDNLAAVGGSLQFVQVLREQMLYSFEAQVKAYLRACLRNFQELHRGYSGLYEFLANLYGQDTARQLLRDNGLSSLLIKS